MSEQRITTKPTWHRQPSESILVYEMFLCWLELGSQRSNDAVLKRFPDHELADIAKVRHYWRWTRRGTDYDDHLIRVQQQAIEKALTDEAVIWAQRRSQFREREFKLAEGLMARAEEMINTPLYETTINKVENINGQEVAVDVTMMPTKWNLRDATEFFKTASQTMRLSLELDTFRATVNLNLPDDVADRLAKAHAILSKLKEGLDKALDEMLEKDPTLDRSALSVRLLEKYIGWTSTNMQVDRNLLTEGDGIVDQMAAQINAANATDIDDAVTDDDTVYDVH